MLKHILIPLDTSAAAETVVDRFMPLLVRPGVDVTLLHATTSPLSAPLDPAKTDEATEDAHETLKVLSKRLGSKGVNARVVVKPGPAADAILAAAAERPGGMIAMGTHGRGGLARMALGSVAESVVRRSPMPVLLTRTILGEGEARVAELHPRRILVPVDGSLLALWVVPHAAELAKAFKSEVSLLHVLPPTPARGDSVDHASRVLDAAKARFADEGIEPETLIRSGVAAEEIRDAARDRGANLIACTTHGRTGLMRAVMGSVAETLLRTSGLPMLVVRSQGA